MITNFEPYVSIIRRPATQTAIHRQVKSVSLYNIDNVQTGNEVRPSSSSSLAGLRGRKVPNWQ